MAANLNPGADSTLVNVAYKAGMAHVPQDYSKTFQSVADSYARSMAETGRMWGQLAKVAVKTYQSIDKQARGPQQSADVQDLVGLETSSGIRDSLKDIHKEILKTYNPLNFGPENKQNRADLIRKRNDYNNQLTHISEHTKANSTALANADRLKTPTWNLEKSFALEQSKNGLTTDYGNYMQLEEVDGKLKYVMYHDPEKATITTGIDGGPLPPLKKGPWMDGDKKLSFSAEEVADGLILNDPEEVMKGGMEAVYDQIWKTASDKPLTERETNIITAQIKKYSSNPAAWKQRTWAGENGGMSWFEEMKSESVASATHWGMLKEAFGDGKPGEKTIPSINDLPEKHPLRAIPDTDKISGLSEGDLINMWKDQNAYKNYFAALFEPSHPNYDGQQTALAFEANEMARIERIRTSGWAANKNNPINKADNPDDPAYDPPYMKESRSIREKIKTSMDKGFSKQSLEGLPWSKKGGAKVIKEDEDGIFLVYQKSGNVITKINPQNYQETLNTIYNNTDIRPGHANIEAPKPIMLNFLNQKYYNLIDEEE